MSLLLPPLLLWLLWLLLLLLVTALPLPVTAAAAAAAPRGRRQMYTLGPQPGSTIERNLFIRHDRMPDELGTGTLPPNAVYHDNGR